MKPRGIFLLAKILSLKQLRKANNFGSSFDRLFTMGHGPFEILLGLFEATNQLLLTYFECALVEAHLLEPLLARVDALFDVGAPAR